MKTVIVQAGGGAAGKSTTTKAFAIGEPEEHREILTVDMRYGPDKKKVVWVFYANCGAAGNHHSGSDSNSGPGLVKAALYKVLEQRDIAMVDGMCSTPKWVSMCNDWPGELQVLLVHYDLSAEDLLDRLANRRQVDKETIREKMYPKCVGLVRRAEIIMEHFHNDCTRPMEIIVVNREHATEEIVDMIDERLFEMIGQPYVDMMEELDGGWDNCASIGIIFLLDK